MRTPFTLAPTLALAAALACSLPAGAVVVPIGVTLTLPGTTAAADPSLAGTVVEDELLNFSLPVSHENPALITGVLQQRVVRTDRGTLDFYWRVRDLQGGSLGYVRLGKFVIPQYDVDWRIDGLGDVGPTSFSRFSPGQGGAPSEFYGDFNFIDAAGADTLAPGQESKFMVLRTSATQYARTAFVDLASSGKWSKSDNFDAFAPAVPEPGTWLLMAAGLALLLRRRP